MEGGRDRGGKEHGKRPDYPVSLQRCSVQCCMLIPEWDCVRQA